MGSGRPSIAKRQRELKQIEKRKAKEEKRAQRRAERQNRPSVSEIEPVPETSTVTPEG